jgi:molecular chaperone DnaJ
MPTVSGARVRVTIPAGTQSGHQFRIKAKGMPVLNSKMHGNMFVQATVETPVNLTRRQKDLLKEFEESSRPEMTSPESEGFFTRAKELWEDHKD